MNLVSKGGLGDASRTESHAIRETKFVPAGNMGFAGSKNAHWSSDFCRGKSDTIDSYLPLVSSKNCFVGDYGTPGFDVARKDFDRPVSSPESHRRSQIPEHVEGEIERRMQTHVCHHGSKLLEDLTRNIAVNLMGVATDADVNVTVSLGE